VGLILDSRKDANGLGLNDDIGEISRFYELQFETYTLILKALSFIFS
tara:strand:+ start:335 stop:475 length:141 start_codon:yes stop_codon:yes gene_type:complete